MFTLIKKSILVISILLLTAITCTAADWKGEVIFGKTIPTASDTEKVIQSGTFLQAALHRGSGYLYISQDITTLRYAGQSGVDLRILSFGVGVERNIGEYLTFGLDFGWYEPDFNGMDKLLPHYSSPFAEGLCRYMNKFLMPDDSYPAWDYYSLKYQGSLGGKLNLKFEYPITESLSFNILAAYRYLHLIENVKGKNDDSLDSFWTTHYWTIKYDRDFSTFLVGATLQYKF